MASIRRRLGLRLEILENRTLLSSSTPTALQAANDPTASLVVGFAAGTSEQTRQAALGAFGEVVETFDSGTSLVALRPGVDADQALHNLRADPALRFAEPNRTLHITATPNDPSFSQQWGLGSAGINAPAAWDVTTGATSVLVAVVDTGVDYNHPDLSGRLWVNASEVPDNGIDDDSNGYVDDVRGWNFVANTNDPLDDHGHGTHVAGTVGAATNNARGVAGVDWNARILPLKFLGANGSGTTAAAIRSIEYAAQLGARIINASWGSPDNDPALAEAIRYAGTLGAIFIAAAGNSGSNNDSTPFYPAAYRLPNLIAVAATTAAGTLASFSNYGPASVAVAAPGAGILSTTRGGGYGSLSGTSMAAPHVSGVAALVASRWPQLTADQLAARIKTATRPLAALAGKVTSGGIVDASLAVTSSPEVQVLDGSADLTDGSGSVDFGHTAVNTPVVRTFTVRNLGTAALTLGSIAVPAGFSLAAGFGAGTLAPGASTQFALRFDAAAAGTAAGRVAFGTNDADENPFDFAVSAIAFGPARIIDDGDAGFAVAGGGWSSAGQGYQGDFRYTAAGTGSRVASWVFTGLAAGRYRVSATWHPAANRASNAPFSVTDGAAILGAVAINQRLVPDDFSDAGAAWEDLGGPYSVTADTLVVRLTNQADANIIADAVRVERLGDLIPGPEVQVLDGSTDVLDGTGAVDLGTTTVGTPVVRTFTVRNLGTAALTLGSIAVPAGFSLAAGFGAGTLAPGASTQFALRFDAAAAGTAAGRVAFGTNDADEDPFDFAVSATATPPPTARILDDGDAGFAVAGGGWSSAGQGYQGDFRYAAAGTGSRVASWTFTGLAAGRYRVSATWRPAANRATNAPFTVADGAATLGIVALNQRLAPDDFSDAGAAWEDLSDPFDVISGTLVVRLTNQADANVIADAVRIERLGNPEPTVYVDTNQELNTALAVAGPEMRILLQPDTYTGGIYVVGLHGAPGNPIVSAAADPSQRPVIHGSGDDLHLVDPQYVEVADLILDGATHNGLNIDDGVTYGTPAHHVTLRNLTARNVVGTTGSNGIKLAGVDQFELIDATINGWNSEGSGLDLVGCHDGVIAILTFRNGDRGGANGIQDKVGSARSVVRDSRFEQAGARADQIGGSTGLQFFRTQPLPSYEAWDITVDENVIVGSEAAIAFVNVDGSTVRFNTIYRPTRWAIRMLQETTAPELVPSRNGIFIDNIIAFRSNDMDAAVNVGGNMAPGTF